MQPQQNLSGSSGTTDQSSIVCAQCGSPMPREMRFCRACGHRLGEGPAEYTETVRFPNANATGQGVGGGFAPPYAAPIAQRTTGFPYRRRRRFSGMTWLIIAMVALFAMGGGLSALKRRMGNAPRISFNFNRTYFGVDGFKDAQ